VLAQNVAARSKHDKRALTPRLKRSRRRIVDSVEAELRRPVDFGVRYRRQKQNGAMGQRIALRLRADRDRSQTRNCRDGAERAHRSAIAEISKQDRHRRIRLLMQLPGDLCAISVK
jgi:hypothetical protein